MSVPINHGCQRAKYSQTIDAIQMPLREAFRSTETPELRYGTIERNDPMPPRHEGHLHVSEAPRAIDIFDELLSALREIELARRDLAIDQFETAWARH